MRPWTVVPASRTSRLVSRVPLRDVENPLSADVLSMVGGGGDGSCVDEESFGRTGDLNGSGESGPPPFGRCKGFFGKVFTSRRGPRDPSRLVRSPRGQHDFLRRNRRATVPAKQSRDLASLRVRSEADSHNSCLASSRTSRPCVRGLTTPVCRENHWRGHTVSGGDEPCPNGVYEKACFSRARLSTARVAAWNSIACP